MGNLTDNSKIFLENRLKKKIVHINLPYGNPGNMIKKFKISLTARDLIILTLPTPKQEQLADLIRKKYKFYKILCLGGAVAMASGEEIPVPNWMDKFGLEFLWRLRKETFRRSKRLFLTFGSYIFYELFSNKYNKIRRRVIL
jgi:UDP-N-acetyl-D-mannosaminuronic acid transferase (WecB/TagA/CpsF family)